jgi:protein tyrosine/serine phosphatase
MKILIALVAFLGAVVSPGEVRAQATRQNSPTGTTLLHFGRVDEGVYKGSKPHSDADYRFLQSLHLKYIVDLEVVPLMYRPEKAKAKRYGILLIPARMNASPLSPSEKHVAGILAMLRDRRYHPIYFHCALGRDRTSLIATLYKMYFLGMPQHEAEQYLHDSGYKDGWVRSGLTRYLEDHPTRPAALR